MAARPESRRLVVVSNRLPLTLRRSEGRLRAEPSTGGLVTALDPAMRRRRGAWVGWPGAQAGPGEEFELGNLGYELAPVYLSQSDVRRYYHGFSNRALWPLFHSFPERTRFDRGDWERYELVNRRFAEVTLETAAADDLVFVQDYHLMTAAAELREQRPDIRCAFFLHIPFPPFDVYRILPWDQQLLRGVLACDLVAFHCPGYVSNFLDCVERLLGERVDRHTGLVEHGDRTVRVAALPLGIDYRAHERRALEARRVLGRDEQIILAVDRLDYTKGIPERIMAFERLLEKHPEHRQKVALLQIAVPSRAQVAEYQALKRQIDELVGRVNGRFGTDLWTPIRYLYRSVAPDRLAALYRDADVGIVTPLRDGMNLVAKEFVASQVDRPGVLVLSRLAGTAERMPEALRVNPYNVESVADRLHDALTMSEEDRLRRIRLLQHREQRNDVHRWMHDFLEAAEQPRTQIAPVRDEELEAWLGDFIEGRRLAVFLDYDGTLAEIASHPGQAQLSASMERSLERCVERDDTDIAVVSGRSLEEVRRKIGHDEIVYAGNHGLEIAGPGLAPFRHADIAYYEERAKELSAALGQIDGEGVWVEQKGASLTLHFRQADPTLHREIAARAEAVILEAGFQARDALCAVEARPPVGWDKGHAVLHILRTRYGPAWSEELRVLYVGDDETDEDAFRALHGLGVTFRVGRASRPSDATRRLSSVASVGRLLEWLAERPGPERWDRAHAGSGSKPDPAE